MLKVTPANAVVMLDVVFAEEGIIEAEDKKDLKLRLNSVQILDAIEKVSTDERGRLNEIFRFFFVPLPTMI